MSVHYCCDKCGLPMEESNPFRIDWREYNICEPCRKKIMEGLGGKGQAVLYDCEKERLRGVYDNKWTGPGKQYR